MVSDVCHDAISYTTKETIMRELVIDEIVKFKLLYNPVADEDFQREALDALHTDKELLDMLVAYIVHSVNDC